MQRVVQRLKSLARNAVRYASDSKIKTPIFVVGCQRSGTTMVLNVAERSSKIKCDREGTGQILDKQNYRVISDDVILKTISRTPEPVIFFKPLNDSQHVDQLLALDSRAKALWVYRNCPDVIGSALTKWGDKHRTIIHQVSRGEYSSVGWEAIGERVSQENLDLVKRRVAKGLSPADGAALLWYLRNSIYFDLKLESEARVLLCKYEDLVTTPQEKFKELFEFVGTDFNDAFVSDIHASSVNKKSPVDLDPEIGQLCDTLMTRLDAAYASRPVVAVNK